MNIHAQALGCLDDLLTIRRVALIQRVGDESDVMQAGPNFSVKLKQFGIRPTSPKIRLFNAFGFFDFVKLEKNSLAVMTDSGTVQEECSILGIPNITLRDVTERPETIECGSNILAGSAPETIVRAVEIAIAQPASWTAPREYLAENVSQTVSKILLGYVSLRRYTS